MEATNLGEGHSKLKPRAAQKPEVMAEDSGQTSCRVTRPGEDQSLRTLPNMAMANACESLATVWVTFQLWIMIEEDYKKIQVKWPVRQKYSGNKEKQRGGGGGRGGSTGRNRKKDPGGKLWRYQGSR